MSSIKLTVNGKQISAEVEDRTLLVHLLRDHLGLTGTHIGCDTSQCGACTVHIDGRSVKSCTVLVGQANGSNITTIEGIAKGDELHPMQAAFIEHDAFQCGYCTPGQICSAVGLMNEGHAKTEDDIREEMAGNICRCGAYPHIVAAVRQVLERA